MGLGTVDEYIALMDRFAGTCQQTAVRIG